MHLLQWALLPVLQYSPVGDIHLYKRFCVIRTTYIKHSPACIKVMHLNTSILNESHKSLITNYATWQRQYTDRGLLKVSTSEMKNVKLVTWNTACIKLNELLKRHDEETNFWLGIYQISLPFLPLVNPVDICCWYQIGCLLCGIHNRYHMGDVIYSIHPMSFLASTYYAILCDFPIGIAKTFNALIIIGTIHYQNAHWVDSFQVFPYPCTRKHLHFWSIKLIDLGKHTENIMTVQ